MKKILTVIISALCVCTSAWGQFSHTTDDLGYEAHSGDDGRIPDGTYWIFGLGSSALGGRNVTTNYFCWDVKNGSKDDAATLQQYNRNFTDAQKFKVTLVETVTVNVGTNNHHYFYKFQNVNSEKFVEVSEGATVNGTPLRQYSSNDKDQQRFEIVPKSDGAFQIRTKLRKWEFGIYQPRVCPVTSETNPGYNNSSGANLAVTYYVDDNTWALAPVGSQIDGLGGSDYYTIIPMSNENKCLQVKDASEADGAEIDFGTYTGSDNQKWQLEYVTTSNTGDGYSVDASYANKGFYYIKLKRGGKYIHTQTSDKASSSNMKIHQWAGTGVNACWVLMPAGDGYYYIVNQSGQAMDAYGLNTIYGHRMNSATSQKFKIVRVYDGDDTSETIPEGLYRIHSPKLEADPELSLDVQQASKDNSANVGLYDASESSKHQQWIISKDGAMDGFYTIKAHHSKLMLDVQGGKAVEGTNVIQYQKNSGVAQQWRFVIARDGDGNPNTYRGNPVYYIFNYHGFALDDSGGKQISGDNVQIWQSNKTIAQKWALEPCVITKTITDAQYATMWYWDLDLQVPEGLEAFTLKLEGNDIVVPDKKYVAGDRIPKNEAVVVHYIAEDIAPRKTKTFQFPVLQDLEPDTTSPTEGNCLLSTGTDQDINAAEGEYIYRLAKGPKGVGFYMTAPTADKAAGKYLNNTAHLCYLKVAFNAVGVNSVPGCVILEEEK